MELAVHNLNFTVPGGPEAIGPSLLATARTAEEGGVSQFTVMDHYFQMIAAGSRPTTRCSRRTPARLPRGRHVERCRLGCWSPA